MKLSEQHLKAISYFQYANIMMMMMMLWKKIKFTTALPLAYSV